MLIPQLEAGYACAVIKGVGLQAPGGGKALSLQTPAFALLSDYGGSVG